MTTKLWVQDTGLHRAKAASDRSLARLGLEYLDLYLIHQPFGDVHGAWRAMEDLYRGGRVKAIGESPENFDVFGFDLAPEDLSAIAALDMDQSGFFDHRDPAWVKRLAERKLDI